jgi:hypothetical protein
MRTTCLNHYVRRFVVLLMVGALAGCVSQPAGDLCGAEIGECFYSRKYERVVLRNSVQPTAKGADVTVYPAEWINPRFPAGRRLSRAEVDALLLDLGVRGLIGRMVGADVLAIHMGGASSSRTFFENAFVHYTVEADGDRRDFRAFAVRFYTKMTIELAQCNEISTVNEAHVSLLESASGKQYVSPGRCPITPSTDSFEFWGAPASDPVEIVIPES